MFAHAMSSTMHVTVMIYGDKVSLSTSQQQAIEAFVNGGHGVVALHSVGDLPLVGARLQSQGGAEFTAEITQPVNPVVQGLQPFAAWEEPVAQSPSGNRTVVMLIVSTLQMPAQQGRSICEVSWYAVQRWSRWSP